MDNMRLDNKNKKTNRETQLHQHCKASKRFRILQNTKDNIVEQTSASEVPMRKKENL
jgi:hypothetical protein